MITVNTYGNRPIHNGKAFSVPTMTKQEFVETIPMMIERFNRLGMVATQNQTIAPQWGDFTNLPDLREAHRIMNEGNQQFMSLDPKVRKMFNNDPLELLKAIEDPNQKEFLQNAGILKKEEVSPQSGGTEGTGPA